MLELDDEELDDEELELDPFKPHNSTQSTAAPKQVVVGYVPSNLTLVFVEFSGEVKEITFFSQPMYS